MGLSGTGGYHHHHHHYNQYIRVIVVDEGVLFLVWVCNFCPRVVLDGVEWNGWV